MGGQLLAEYYQGTTYFVTKDHLGSARLVSAVNGSVADSMDYYPYGIQMAGGTTTTHKFTGDERDSETGLDHTPFRQYSSSVERWMTPDPAGLAAVDPTNPQSWNRYAYVLNNPLALVDPSGLCDVDGVWDCPMDQDPPGGGGGYPGVPFDNGPSNPALSGVCPAQYARCTFLPNGNVLADSGDGSGYIFYTAPYEDSKNGLGYYWAPVLFFGGGGGGGGIDGGGGGRNGSKSKYNTCISNFYNSTDGKITQFLAPTSLIPGWNPGAWGNIGNWAEAIGTKAAVTELAIAQSNAGQVEIYSLTAGTTTVAPSVSVVEGTVGGIASKLVVPAAAATSGRDILAHANCAVQSILPGPITVDLLDLVP